MKKLKGAGGGGVIHIFKATAYKLLSMIYIICCGLFNDAVSSSDHIASNVRMINE
jgi:hypothetical protein